MAQTAPSSDKSGKRASSPLVPPDERFWQRYSQHGEFPLSSIGSLLLHVLLLGLLGLAAWLGATLFSQGSRSLPVETVRLELGGGGGNPHGGGDDPNNGPAPREAGDKPNEGPAENIPAENVPAPKINVDPNPQIKPQFDDQPGRQIQQIDEANSVFQRLTKSAKRIQSPDSKPPASGYGKGGTGSGGGSGDGRGTGTGNQRGAGPGNLTQREKRNLRWTMLFNTVNSSDYVAQLHGLGAILAIPDGPRYKIIRDLSARPAKLLDEDINSILRMVKWIDDKPDSVRGVMSVLGLNLRPDHFFAFMPPKLEEKLLRLEIAYLNKRHRGRREDDIIETKFLIRIRNGKYEPEVKEQEVK